MIIRFLEETQAEFLDAISFYEEARGGMGQRFKSEVERCIHWIAAHPELYRLRPGGYHRINLRIFPDYIPYIVREQTLWILAVGHASRKPHYWIARRNHIG